MGALQTSLGSKTTATAAELVRATLRRRELTRSVSQADKLQAFGGRLTSPAARKEWDLVQQAIAGNAGAQEQLFKAHTPRLFRMAFGVLRNKEDAEDAVQDSWCRAYRKLGSFQGRSAFSTWLTRISMNSALMRRRRKKVRTEASLDKILDNHSESILDRAVDERPNPEQACLAIEVKALIAGQIRQLPPGMRRAFRLREVEGFSATETMGALGIHNSALKSRISRARQRLAGALEQSILRPARVQAGSQRVRRRKHFVSFQKLMKNVRTVLDQQAQTQGKTSHYDIQNGKTSRLDNLNCRHSDIVSPGRHPKLAISSTRLRFSSLTHSIRLATVLHSLGSSVDVPKAPWTKGNLDINRTTRVQKESQARSSLPRLPDSGFMESDSRLIDS